MGLVVDRPARELQDALLAELDDISPDHVPAIVNAVLAPLLAASKRQARIAVGHQRQPPAKEMSEAAAAGFLVVLDILPKVSFGGSERMLLYFRRSCASRVCCCFSH